MKEIKRLSLRIGFRNWETVAKINEIIEAMNKLISEHNNLKKIEERIRGGMERRKSV